jgi:hypothetical protein
MIIFDLKCADGGHVFEAWFGSSEDYEDQRRRGLIDCPLCGCPDVAKAVMAPSVGAKANRGLGRSESAGPQQAATELVSGDPQTVKQMLAAIATIQRKMLEGSEGVGDRFADEARAIHLGESEKRAIHGSASRADAESLIEDGIPVAPLPFPVIEPGEEN